jgi:hypothetical protein
MEAIMTITDMALGEITPPTSALIYMTIGAGADLLLLGAMEDIMVVSTEAITDITILGDGTVTDTATVGTTGAGVAMAGTTGAGAATVGAVITALTTILLTDPTLITIPVIGLETITTTEVMPITPAGGAFTAPIPT